VSSEKNGSTDSVVGSVTITSGGAIALGTRGATITFDFNNTADALVLGDKWQVTGNTFNNTVRSVVRARHSIPEIKTFPTIILATGSQQYDGADGDKYTNVLTVMIEAWIQQRNNIDQELNDMLDDIENVLADDTLRSNNAFDTLMTSAEPFFSEDTKPLGVINIEAEVTYHQVIR